MVRVYSKALDQYIEIDRLIGHIKGTQPGPTLIFTGGIHGNEPAGVFALRRVLQELSAKDILIKGNIYAISGNLWALARGNRYRQEDLNRLWTSDRMEHLLEGKIDVHHEDVVQQIDIYHTIRKILDTEKGPFYFIDLHTTSSETQPFLTVNDSLLNRKFTMQYPVPMILGIEEYLEGPLLSYINELGYVAFGFEGGQHDAPAAIENMVSFIYLTMFFAGNMDKAAINYDQHYELLAKVSPDSHEVYEIYSRYEIKEEEMFSMEPGFINFQQIHKGQKLAVSNGKAVNTCRSGKIFMPLYQRQGHDGFFTIRRIHPFFLRLSAILRKIRFDRVLHLLPGVRWASDKQSTLIVNRKVARFFTKQFFHLLGYRSKRINKTYILMRNRETASRESEYLQADWYRNKSRQTF